jgi:hypothetical protein
MTRPKHWGASRAHAITAPVEPPSTIPEGRVQCGACGRHFAPTRRGTIRMHNDPSGDTCVGVDRPPATTHTDVYDPTQPIGNHQLRRGEGFNNWRGVHVPHQANVALARRTVASQARTPDECRMFLEMLGIDESYEPKKWAVA